MTQPYIDNNFNDKTIDHIEIIGEIYTIYFIDKSTLQFSTYIEESPSRHWGDEAKLKVKYSEEGE